ncbi:SDR family oxidoreductase [Rhodococcus hoagii]|nr:SDR family oxidoreductase [Prescottella equi]
MTKLSGKTAIVLGVAPGNVGHAIARRYADDGATVLVAGRRPDALAEVADGIGAQWQPCDITSEADLDALVERARNLFGHIDVGVNATGGVCSPLSRTPPARISSGWLRSSSPGFQFFQRLVANMPNGGSIIQISSVTASIMFENHAAYMAPRPASTMIRCIATNTGSAGSAPLDRAGGVATPRCRAVD